MNIEIDIREFYDRPLTEPNESDKQFARYLVYRNLDPLERSMRKATELLNEQGDDVAEHTIHNTGHKYRWNERAKAFDNYLASIELTVLETSLEGAINYVLENEDKELVMATRLMHNILRRAANGEQAEEKETEADRAKKVLATLDLLQKMRRRRAGLPVNYITKEAEKQDFESQTFIIGAE